MRYVLKLVGILALSTQLVLAAEQGMQRELKIALPDAQWLLSPVSPPQLQKEGLALPAETTITTELLGFIAKGEYAEALLLLREQQEPLLQLLETGDPAGLLKSRVVAGGFMPSTRPNQISATLLYLIGHIYFSDEQYEPAETAFKSALIPLPDYIRVHESLGLLYLQTKRFDESRVHLAHAVSLGMNTANLFGALGYLNQQTNNYWGASSAYQQAMIQEPDNANWQRGLLYSLVQTYQYQSALTLVEQLLQADPDDANLWVFRTQLSIQAGEKSAALTSLETAIRLGENQVANLQVCASLHMELGSIARAVELLQSGFAQGMDFVFINQALEWLEQQGEWTYLEAMLTTMRSDWSGLDDEKRSRVLTREASVSLNKDQQAAARAALQEALQLDPSNADALMALGAIQRDARNYNQAELLFQRASAYTRYRENALISLAQLAIDQDNFQRALQLLREVVSNNPARSDLSRNIDSLENLVLLQE